MKPAKDLFSTQADGYKKFRPRYPAVLYQRILAEVKIKDTAWDSGTGNGQVAVELAKHFRTVRATDISDAQLAQAEPLDNIVYSVSRAEQTNFPANSFNLITVAQALQWFDFAAFYQEARRVSKPAGILAVWGYGVLQFQDEKINARLQHFYHIVTGPHWDPERRYLDEAYATIPFDFPEIPVAETFSIAQAFTFPDLQGYLNTWSSVKKMCAADPRTDPVGELIATLSDYWPVGAVREAVHPVYLRIGRIDQ